MRVWWLTLRTGLRHHKTFAINFTVFGTIQCAALDISACGRVVVWVHEMRIPRAGMTVNGTLVLRLFRCLLADWNITIPVLAQFFTTFNLSFDSGLLIFVHLNLN